jgi:hypothetical protein
MQILLLLLRVIRKTLLICPATDLVLDQRVFATTRKDRNAKSEEERVGEEIMTLAETKNIHPEDADEEHPPVQEGTAIIIPTTIPEIITVVEAMIVELLTHLVLLRHLLFQTCHLRLLTLHWIHAVRRINHRIHTMIPEGHILHLLQSMMLDETIRLIRQGILMIIIAEVTILGTYLLNFLERHHRHYLPRTKQ